MKIYLLFITLLLLLLNACDNNGSGVLPKNVQTDTLESTNVLSHISDSIISNGEYIKYYQNGVIEMRGIMKDGKREGLWKSWYDNGAPWSETTFEAGKKHGKTTTWYPNDKKRYEGFYTQDKESGHWTFWDQTGKVQQEKDFK